MTIRIGRAGARTVAASVNFVVLYTLKFALIDAQDLAGRRCRCDWRAR
jgi:hypothetical protein